MDLTLDASLASDYKSPAQIARVVTEAWFEDQAYCPNCTTDTIEAHRPGKKVEDFHCPTCDRRVQLKAKSRSFGRRIVNSAYQPKIKAIRANEAPDYAFLRYDKDDWRVQSLLYVPGHFLTPGAVEAREPLSDSARRSGWVGSNILLDRIPEQGRLWFVDGGEAVPRDEVRERFDRLGFVADRDVEGRGWLADVLGCVEELVSEPGDEFTLEEMYGFEDELSERWPDNEHIRAKIRQQLQVLRDEGVLEFVERGLYRMR